MGLQAVLSVHKNYIISVSECQELMEQMHKILEDRTQHYSSVFQLVGKLEILKSRSHCCCIRMTVRMSWRMSLMICWFLEATVVMTGRKRMMTMMKTERSQMIVLRL